MKKSEFTIDAKSIRGSSTRPVKAVSLNQLSDSGNTATYGIGVDDIIEFPDSLEDLVIYEQEVRPGSSAKQILIGVFRNSKPSFLSVGVLRRVDKDMVPTCDFTKEMYTKYTSDKERVSALIGKKIKCSSVEMRNFNEFTPDGVRIPEKFTEKVVPIIEYA